MSEAIAHLQRCAGAGFQVRLSSEPQTCQGEDHSGWDRTGKEQIIQLQPKVIGLCKV